MNEERAKLEKEYEELRQKFNAMVPKYNFNTQNEAIAVIEDISSLVESKEYQELWKQLIQKFNEIEEMKKYD